MRKRSFRAFEERIRASGLYTEITKRALVYHVSLQELYEGTNRAPSIMAARRAVYTWLAKRGKGGNEIARMFDRAQNGVAALLRKSKS